MADAKYSVTLTGRVLAGRDAPSVWSRVAVLLKLDAAAFRERVLARLPVTLQAVGYDDARRQREALVSSGADVLLLPEDAGPRLWIRLERSTHGPLSMAYARHALREGHVSGDTPACVQGHSAWEPLQVVLARHAPRPSPAPAAHLASGAASRAPAPAKPRPAPVRHGLPGWVLGLLVGGISLALIGALVALLAIPAYRDHRVRGQVAQGMALAAPSMRAVERYLHAHGGLPADNTAAGVAAASSIRGPYVDSVNIDHGEISVHFGAAAAARLRGRHLLLTPHADDRTLRWTCLGPGLASRELPAACR